jgi:hypothetical protein
LLYRAFLNLVVKKREKHLSVNDAAVAPAAKCIQLAMELINFNVLSMPLDISGVLEAAVFHAMNYLWNAALTLLLYIKSTATQEALAPSVPEQRHIVDAAEQAAAFFTQRDTSPVAMTAAEKIRRLLKRMSLDYVLNDSSTTTDIHAGFDVPTLQSPDQILNFMPGFDSSTFDFSQYNYDMNFPGPYPQNPGAPSDFGSTSLTNAQWALDGQNFHIPTTSAPG